MGILSASNVYEKSACFINSTLTYEAANANCLQYGMKLLQIEITNTNLASSVLARGVANKFFVDGKDGTNCKNVNNLSGSSAVEFGNCTTPAASVCEFLELNRKNDKLRKKLLITTCFFLTENY
jgi:hypothetical protein